MKFKIKPGRGNLSELYFGKELIAKIHFHSTNVILYKDNLYFVETPYSSEDQEFHIYKLGEDLLHHG